MTFLHQVAYSWRHTPVGLVFGPRAATLTTPELSRWHGRVEHWLRTEPDGSVAPSHFYGVFGDDAVLVRRVQPARMRSAEAWLLTGPATVLTPRLALELRDWRWLPDRRTTLIPFALADLAPYRDGLETAARSPECLALLVPLVAHFLAGAEGPITMPPSEHAYPVLWGFQEIVGSLAIDRPERGRWAMSFETYDDRARPPDHPGLFVRFRKGAPDLPVPETYEPMARTLVTDHTRRADTPAPRFASQRRRTSEPTAAPPSPSASPGAPPDGSPASPTPGPQARNASSGVPMPPSAPARPATPATPGRQVTCPICLSSLNWDEAPRYRYDPATADYVELTIPPTASDTQRAVALRTAFVRCTDAQEQGSSHYLPLAYGQHGPPAVYGFVGATRSGKTHLLTAMIGQLEKHGLGLGIGHQPIGLAGHKALLDEQVGPFLNESRVIDQTRTGTIGLVDAFLVGEPGRERRPVVLFDVAGGDLLEIDSARRFLDIADGLIFVVNAAELGRDELGDRTFGTVLELLQASDRLSKVSAAIVLNKADLLRFDDPVARWMRHPDRTLDAEDSLRESADVYGYLHARGAAVWTRPYRECRRATLHVVSAAGSDAVVDKTFVRGVRPRRVLNPLLALMATTGVLTSPEAQKIGI